MSDTRAELEALYNQSIKVMQEGQVVTGKIVAIKPKEVLVDVGFKSEGIVPVTEFSKGINSRVIGCVWIKLIW